MDTLSLELTKMSILDLPTELIVHICCCDILKINDIFNLALSHPKLKISLFCEQNSSLWKSKYIQKYGQLDKNEYKITINEQNIWRDELKLRMFLDKAVPSEIMQMPCKYIQFKNIPYHLYPFSDKLNSDDQAHRYYVLHASATYYKLLLSDKCNKNYDLQYMAHHFLVYSCQVYFGYKIKDFLCLPPKEQTVEQGFYLLSRWWSPTVDTPYSVINTYLNNIAIHTLNLIEASNPTHPLFENENCLEELIQRGKINLNCDLYNEPNTMLILDAIGHTLLSDSDLVCFCTNMKCYMLQQVIERNKGSVFLISVLYESVARRLGVKVRITATSVHNFISWSSSWPGNKFKNPACHLIDITCGGIIRKASVCPVTKELPKHFEGNSIPDLFWTFTKTMEQLTIEDLATCKYILDFQKIIRPDDAEVEFKCQKFHQYYELCRCPLLRTSFNSCENFKGN